MGEGGRRERGKREGKKGEGVKWGGEGGREEETLLCACSFRHVTRAGISPPPPIFAMEHLCNLAALLHLLILHNSRTLHGSSRTRASRSKKHAGPAFRLRLSKFLGNYQIGSIGANTSKEKSG